ncbi:hypothetical protein HN587_05280 [Candidatus Woesearchaeota archaeon]|nr:hypothetical protein [Candidatus Woesearchaeota archaeon]
MTYNPESGMGIYLAMEGIDGSGQGTIVKGIEEWFAQKGLRTFNLTEAWQDGVGGAVLRDIYGTTDVCPAYEDLKKYFADSGIKLDSIILCEPTFEGVGLKIRNHATHEIEGLDVSAEDTAALYAYNRGILIPKTILPALQDGVHVISERSFVTSVVYQSIQDDGDLEVERIVQIPGNVLAIRNRPDVYIICDLDGLTAVKRLAMRKKQDKCKFENAPFLDAANTKYQSKWLREMLSGYGCKVVYLSTRDPRGPKDTERFSVEIIEQALEGRLVSGARFE